MRFVRNWLLPIFATGIGALLGVIVIGLPGFNVITTMDGKPMLDGISAEQINSVIAGKHKIGSYIDFYGIQLPGEPFYWSIGIIAVSAFIGYRMGSKFKVRQNVVNAR